MNSAVRPSFNLTVASTRDPQKKRPNAPTFIFQCNPNSTLIFMWDFFFFFNWPVVDENDFLTFPKANPHLRTPVSRVVQGWNWPTRCPRPNPPNKLTAPTVGNGFHSPKSELSWSDIKSSPLKSERPDSIDPFIFPVIKCRSGVFWDFFWEDLG